MTVDELITDDETWRLVWERTLSHAERHEIAMSVLRRRPPADPFERRLAAALAHRWRRHAAVLTVPYLLWSLFWGAIGWHSVALHGLPTAALPVVCTVVGVASIAACVAFWRRMRLLTATLQDGV